MVNRRLERSCSFRLRGSFVAGVAVAIALAGFSTLLAPQTMASELRAGDLFGEDSTLVDPAGAKAFPLDNHALDGTDLALFPKARSVPRGPGLDQEARCSWWLPRELPLGGGFTYALFCDGSVVGGNGQYSAPLLADS
ncbi:MAG: hypothetical protein ACTSX7_04700 [Alphaproteobacteria bacterium]